MKYTQSLRRVCVSVVLALTLVGNLAAAQAPHLLQPTASVPAPFLLYPVGGETLPAGSADQILWDTNGASEDTTYRVEVTNACHTGADFFDDVEGGVNGWTVSHVGGETGWGIAFDLAHSPSQSWLALSPDTVSDMVLVSPAFRVSQGAILSFWHYYELEGWFDGGVVEIRPVGGQTWTDLGPLMRQNGYTEQIRTGTGSPIAGRQAFTGVSDGWVETQVDLAGYTGQTVQIRFRQATDEGVANFGWAVDDILVGRQSWSLVGISAPGATELAWTAPTQPGDDYCVRVRGEAAGLDPSAWSTGAPFSVTGPDTTATATGTALSSTATRTPSISATLTPTPRVSSTPTATSSPTTTRPSPTRTPSPAGTPSPLPLTSTPTATGTPGLDLDGGVMVIGDRVTGQLHDHQDTDVFYFSGRAGQSVRVEVNALSPGLQPAVTLADATHVVHNDETAHGPNARLEVFQLPVTGTYKLLVAAAGSASSGDYELLLKPLYQDNVVAAVSSAPALSVYSAEDADDPVFGLSCGTLLGFSPDGLSAAVASGAALYVYSTRQDDHILFSRSSGRFLGFSPDGAAAVVSDGGALFVYSTRQDSHILFSRSSGSFIAFSPDGSAVAISDGSALYVYSTRQDSHILFSRSSGVFLGFSPDSTSAAVSDGSALFVYSTRQDSHTLFSRSSGRFLGFSPDGAAAAVSDGSALYVYSTRQDSHILFSRSSGVFLGFSPDSTSAAVSDGSALYVYSTRQDSHTLFSRSSGVFLGFSPDSAAAAVSDGSALYVYSTRQDSHILFSRSSGVFLGFSPDGASAAVSDGSALFVYSTRQDSHTLFSRSSGSFIAFSPDSAAAAVSDGSALFVYSTRGDNRLLFSRSSGSFIAYSFTFGAGGGGCGGASAVFLPLIARNGAPPAVPPGALTGQVVNAINAQPLANVTIQVVGAGLTTTTGPDGRYSFADVPSGPQAVSASLSGFVTTTQDITIQRNTTNTLNFALSPVLAAGEMRIVLDWGERPTDLDSHLWLPQDRPYHIYFARFGTVAEFPFAALDVDDTSSFGPETVTIRQRVPGRYLYAVYNYSNDTSINVSRARVSVYAGAAQVGQYTFPGGDGRWWTVLAIDGTSGQVTLINTVNDTCPGYVCEGQNKMEGQSESAQP